MRVLCLEPYYGGSHRAFLDGWARHSRHALTCWTLAAHHWKWRMQHASVTFAQWAAPLESRESSEGNRGPQTPFDVIWASDMLDLAAFRGLGPAWVRRLPCVTYFHENQLTYPSQHPSGRDLFFGFTNMTSALAAVESGGAIWWNSAYNRDTFLSALEELVSKMPKPRLSDAPARIAAGSQVHYPGIESIGPARPDPHAEPDKPLHLLWAARWEHDKNPDDFFAAVDRLHEMGLDFRLNVIGQQFRNSPQVFDAAYERHAHRIHRWGFQPDRQAYEQALLEADVMVSTATHEFFGLSVIEAVNAGCTPLLPRRLSYPELFDDEPFFYDGTVDDLVRKLAEFAETGVPKGNAKLTDRFTWPPMAAAMDGALPHLTQGQSQSLGVERQMPRHV